ncbi:MAG: hypothetical protein WBO18_07500 [Gammaproteobacteria bacterium]
MRPLIAFTTLSFLLCATAHADTVIEFKNQNQKSQFLTNGTMARLNTRGSDEYILVNFSNQSIYTVSPEKKQITNISDALPSISGVQPQPIRLKLKPVGTGPAIAGYSTVKYRLSANGESCGAIFASKDALKGTAVEDLFDTMKAMADNHLRSLGGFAALIPVCQMAKIEMADKLQEVGVPMRTLDQEGRIETEITMILKNAQVGAENYAFPLKYQTISMN